MAIASLELAHPGKTVAGTVQLTGSKSESNRALIIQSISDGKVEVQNLSEAADTVTLKHALGQADGANGQQVVIDIGPAGTAMRFLSALLSTREGDFILTGSRRMQERPIALLVDALSQLGADITYEKNEGYPPLRINGGFEQTIKSVKIKGNVSSQYLSALLLVAPVLPRGLELQIEGELTSRPYVDMTLNMLSEAGITHEWNENTIVVEPQSAQKTTIYVEPDWSAASYWYSIVALSDSGRIFLPGLKSHSLQGDKAIAEIMTHFGVATSFSDDGIHLEKVDYLSNASLFDFKECPDLAQTVIVCAAALQRDVSFTGLKTLRIKETDRIAALQNELAKVGVRLKEDGEVYHLKTADFRKPNSIDIKTYEDHRMAMAFAPLALVIDKLIIEEPSVVEKSYPDFWKHLKQQGFIIS